MPNGFIIADIIMVKGLPLVMPGVDKCLILLLLQLELREKIAVISNLGRHWFLGIWVIYTVW